MGNTGIHTYAHLTPVLAGLFQGRPVRRGRGTVGAVGQEQTGPAAGRGQCVPLGLVGFGWGLMWVSSDETAAWATCERRPQRSPEAVFACFSSSGSTNSISILECFGSYFAQALTPSFLPCDPPTSWLDSNGMGPSATIQFHPTDSIHDAGSGSPTVRRLLLWPAWRPVDLSSGPATRHQVTPQPVNCLPMDMQEGQGVGEKRCRTGTSSSGATVQQPVSTVAAAVELRIACHQGGYVWCALLAT